MLPSIPPIAISSVATALTIAASAVSGGIAVVAFQKLHDRRVMYSSLHTELVDAHLLLRDTSKKLENDPEKSLKRELPPVGLPTNTFESLPTKDPIFYARLCHEARLESLYQTIHSINSYAEFEKLRVSVGVENQRQQEPKQTREERLEIVKNTLEETYTVIEQLEEYRKKSKLRRVFYYGTWAGSPTLEHYEETGSEDEGQAKDQL